jgi:hypothetical protein
MIGLIGTSCTGKTTLAKAVSDRTGIPYIPSPVRGVYQSLGLSVNEPMSFEDRMLAQIKILSISEAIYADMDNIFITDRTPMDFAAHVIAEASAINLSVGQSNILMTYVEECYRITNLYFSSLILLQPALNIVEEIGRTTNKGYLEHINLLMIGFIADPNNKLYCAKHFMKKSVINLKRRVDLVIQIASIVEIKNMKQGESEGIH